MQRTLINERYRLIESLGSGGMAEVYLAHDEVLDRNVALKLLSDRYAGNEEVVERFGREAKSAASLNHPNVVSVYDRGRSEDGTYYIAMEYIPGGTLGERIKQEGPLPPRVAAGVALQISEALSAAHGKGVIHRDIKPHNVLITASGDVTVTDFGIARAAAATVTTTGSILGTASYMSPEQAMGKGVGPASDLYSLGVVLYEMLTGEVPYRAEQPMAVAMKHVSGPPRSPREVNPDVSEALDALTVKLLAKNPEDRYASAAELADDLERVLEGLPLAGTATTQQMTAPLVPPARQPVAPAGKRRPRALTLLGVLFLLALLGVLAWTLAQDLGAPEQAEVPTVVGLQRDAALERLSAAGLSPGDIREAPSASVSEGEIIEQNPTGGTEVEQGSTVDLVVSTGPPVQSAPPPAPVQQYEPVDTAPPAPAQQYEAPPLPAQRAPAQPPPVGVFEDGDGNGNGGDGSGRGRGRGRGGDD